MNSAESWLPVDEGSQVPWTPTRVNSRVRGALHDLPDLVVLGEVTNYSGPSRPGHLYFSLKDEQSTLSAVVWRSVAGKLTIPLKNGEQILAFGRLDVYVQGGRYQLNVRRIELAGAGQYAAMLEERKRRLAEEGLFAPERKRPLPRFPRCLVVVSSEQAAALRDVFRTVERRFPATRLVLAPTPVQGPEAVAGVVHALKQAGRYPRADAVLLVRGGGAREDLAAFDAEEVVRAVVACPLPVVTGIGHATDQVLADLAADASAPTPTGAAELAVPDGLTLGRKVEVLSGRMVRSSQNFLALQQRDLGMLSREVDRVPQRLQGLGHRLNLLRHRLRSQAQEALGQSQQELGRRERALVALHPKSAVERGLDQVRTQRGLLVRAVARIVEAQQQQLGQHLASLDALSPLRVLARGYAIAFDEHGVALRESLQVRRGDQLLLRLARGQVRARVEGVEPPQGASDGEQEEQVIRLSR